MSENEKIKSEFTQQPEGLGEVIRDVSQENINKIPVPREISTWLEKVERTQDNQTNQTVTDNNGQIVLKPIIPPQNKISLNLTKANFLTGFKKPFEDAARWLSVFILRLIKMKDGGVTFKNDVT
ncbi:hypothetical protein KBB92_00355 [Candidatus Shapirobacteria bacterium]|jgi:hypothetical protein|nr:hypothetical protein [Candidatus Shapirobacteria bacterium]HQI13036.1 hypothetical protein [Candidatus Woesebacteria bacterium]